MKKIGIAYFLAALCIMTNIDAINSHADNLAHTAEKLIQSCYTKTIVHKSFTLFIQHDFFTDKNFIKIPSTQEIIAKISQLQNQHGYIEDQNIKQQAINALQAVLQAIKNAIIKVNKKYKPNFLQADFDRQLVKLLQQQKNSVEEKITQLDRKTIWQHLTSKPALYLATGAVILAAGGTYYYYQSQQKSVENSENGTQPKPTAMDSAPANKKIVYKKLGSELLQLLDMNHKYHPSVHLEVIESTLAQLDPAQDTDLIEILQTILQAQDKKDMSLANTIFWANVFKNRARYIGTIIDLLNNDPQLQIQAPNGTTWTTDDINLKDVIMQKDAYPKKKVNIGQQLPAPSISTADQAESVDDLWQFFVDKTDKLQDKLIDGLKKQIARAKAIAPVSDYGIDPEYASPYGPAQQ